MLHIVSSIVLVMVAAGLYFRRKTVVHMRFMVAAFLLDLALVLYIEMTRHAVEKVASHVRPLVYVHAAISLGVLIAYVIMILLGRRVLKGKRASRSTHRHLGMAFVVLRVLNYVTALMM